MNIIHVPLFNITISEPSARQTIIKFVEELISRNPLMPELIYSYMAQEYLPDNPSSKNHILAKRRSSWDTNGYCYPKGGNPLSTIVQLTNGWFLFTHMSPRGYASQLLARIEEAIQTRNIPVKIYAHLVATSDRGPGIRYYSEQDIKLFTENKRTVDL